VKEALHLLELWLDAQVAYNELPGLSIAVVHDQDILWSGGFGYAHPDRKIPATQKTIYSICSISKLFTGIALMQLRDAGRLRLDDPVSKHLPWFTIKQTYPEGPPVPSKGLLTHSSGLPREAGFPYWSAPDFAFPTREQIIEKLASQKTLYPADTYSQYSNLGMTLLGEIVAAVSGQPYREYVQKNILDPLGLTNTKPEMQEKERGKRLATGYSATTREGVRKAVPFFKANGIAPAAGYSSTVEDLAKFASWQFRLREKGGTEILNVNTLKEMQRVQWMDPDWETTWGLGFVVWRRDGKTFVGHGGSCPGFRSQFLIQPKDKIAAIVMVNASGVNTGNFARRAYEIVAPAIAEALKSPEATEPPDTTLEKYTGTYSSQPWGGETAVLVRKGKLAMVGFPTDNPLGRITKLEHIEGNTFRRIRDDDELAEEIVFETSESGKVIGIRRNYNFSPKVR
jgi:CubicO group peptidase (beta-lactamase class C family)